MTAADTVIFYDSDWNPSNDAQAMDRAHRLGQTKQVTVYRLITKDTVDERILQLARQKQLVQNAVVGSSGAAMPSEGPAKANEVVSLLLDDNELQEGLRQAEERRKKLEEKKYMEGKKCVSLFPSFLPPVRRLMSFSCRGATKRQENRKKAEAEAAELAKKKPDAFDDDDEGSSPVPPFPVSRRRN